MTPGSPSTPKARPSLEVAQAAIDPLFLADVSLAQRVMYPALLDNHDQHLKSRGEENPMRWVYFSPLHHAEGGLLTRELIQNLHGGDNILVVGAGLGDIERYLINQCRVHPDRITAADIDVREYPNDLGVRALQFSMLNDWPVERDRYRYILIPEALGMALSWTAGEALADRYQIPAERLLEVSYIARDIFNGGPQSIPVEKADDFLAVVSPPGTRASRSWKVIENALRSLTPHGELRLNGHCLDMRALAALLLYAERSDVPVAQVTLGRHSISFQRGAAESW